MRATVMHGAGDVRIENVRDAALVEPTDATLRVTRACICGSDLWPYASMEPSETGQSMGHEAIGIVEDVGSDVRTLKRGDAGNLLVAVIYSAFFPMFFFLTLYLQRVLHYTPIETGLLFVPLGLAVFVMSVLAPRLVARFSPRAVITAGMLTTAAGLALMTGIAPGRSHAWYGLAGGLLMMAGLGLSLVPSTIVATRGLPRGMSGLGSALMNTSRLLGGALGLAILVTVATAHTRGQVGLSTGQALTDGFSRSLAISAAVCAAGAILTTVLLRGSAAHRHARGPVACDAPSGHDDAPGHDDAQLPPRDLSLVDHQ